MKTEMLDVIADKYADKLELDRSDPQFDSNLFNFLCRLVENNLALKKQEKRLQEQIYSKVQELSKIATTVNDKIKDKKTSSILRLQLKRMFKNLISPEFP